MFIKTGERPENSTSPASVVVPLLALLACLVASVSAYLVVRHELMLQLRAQFRSQSEQMSSIVKQSLESYSGIMYGAQGLFEASHDVQGNEWSAYAKALGLAGNYPGITALIYIERVPRDATSTYPYAIAPLSDKSDYYPITYIAAPTPISATSSAYGFDASSDPVREDAMNRALGENGLAASGKFLTVVNRAPAFGIYAPVYRNGTSTDTLEERETNLVGYVYAACRLDGLFGDLSQDAAFGQGISVAIYDTTGGQAENADSLLFSYGSADPPSNYSEQESIGVEGRIWTLRFAAETGYGSNPWEEKLPLSVLLAGIVFSALIAAGTYFYAASREKTAIVNEKARDDAILGGIADAVFAIDRHGYIILFNRAAAEMSGFSESEAIGKPFQKILSFATESSSVAQEAFIAEALSGKKSSMRQASILIRKDKAVIPVADSAAPFYDSDGNVAGAVIVFRDVTRERQVERAKDEIVSLASHQLRTPLTSVRWNAELLQGGAKKLSKQNAAYLAAIHEAAVKMADIIDSMLNVSRLELGTAKVNPEPLRLSEMADQAIGELDPLIKEKKLHVSKKILFKGPFSQDRMHVTTVLQNLLSNACKYTPSEGSVRIEIAPNEEGGMELKVSDTGIGIPKSEQGKLFGKMFRAKNAKESVPDGSGLGLYVVKSTVELLKGSIRFESKEGEGTTFFVTIPKA